MPGPDPETTHPETTGPADGGPARSGAPAEDGRSSDSRAREIDRAALLGAVLAAVVALTFGGEGEWDWLASASGVALVAIIGAFFRLPRHGRYPHTEVLAMAAVTGLAGALVIASPLQAALSASPAGYPCTAAAELAAAQIAVVDGTAARLAAAELATDPAGAPPDKLLELAGDERFREVYGVCIGATTSSVLWIPAVLLAVVIIVVAEVRLRRG